MAKHAKSRPWHQPHKTECLYCGDRLLPQEREHVRPRCRGGEDDETAVSCISCNRQKNTMLIHEWRAWRERNGMPWPPIASHATSRQAEHYSDGTSCDVGRGNGGCGEKIRAPESFWPTENGYGARYVCDTHRSSYRVSWSVSRGFYFDCPCAFCVAMRAEEEAVG